MGPAYVRCQCGAYSRLGARKTRDGLFVADDPQLPNYSHVEVKTLGVGRCTACTGWGKPVHAGIKQAEAERLFAEYGERRLAYADYDELGSCLTSRASFSPITDMMSRADALDILSRFESLQGET